MPTGRARRQVGPHAPRGPCSWTESSLSGCLFAKMELPGRSSSADVSPQETKRLHPTLQQLYKTSQARTVAIEPFRQESTEVAAAALEGAVVAGTSRNGQRAYPISLSPKNHSKRITQSTAHSTQHIAHNTHHTAQSKTHHAPHTTHSTRHTAHNTRHTTRDIQQAMHSTQRSPQPTHQTQHSTTTHHTV